MILSKSNELYNHFSHYFASSSHKCTATSPWSTVRFEPCQALHSRSIKFPNLAGLGGEQGAGGGCAGVWGHREDTENPSTAQSPSCCHLAVLSSAGRGGWRLMPNLCPSCSSTPELLLGLRPDRLPGSSLASPAATWPFCRLRKKLKK